MEENKNIDESAEVKEPVAEDYNIPNDAVSQKDDLPIKALTRNLLRRFNQSSVKTKKLVVISAVILAFLVGIAGGFGLGRIGQVKESSFWKVANLYDTLKEEYDSYKQKMQPYEAQQQADIQAEEERKAAEEKAKKEAEEKAAEEKAKKEAEERAAADAQAKKEAEEAAAAAKANSLGMSQNEFYTEFNGVAATNGFDVFLGKETVNGSLKTYKTLNSDVTVQTYASNDGFLQTVSISAKRTTSESLADAGYYAVTAAMVLDSSLSTGTVDNLMTDLVRTASNNGGKDYSITKNNIKYTANVDNASILFYFEKEK